MKITIESTNQIVELATADGRGRIPGRIWEGETASGIKVQCIVTRIAAPLAEDLAEFERELTECRPPQQEPQAFSISMRLIL